MWPFLDKPTAYAGTVFFRGPIAPPVEQVLALGLGDVAATRGDAPKGIEAAWAVRLTHPAWGEALVVAPRQSSVPHAEVIRWGTPGLTDAERALLGRAEVSLTVEVKTPERSVLRARKYLLRWLNLLMSLDGLAAVDLASDLFWAPAMLDDELAHDADLDVEALYTIHAIYDEETTPEPVYQWLHTHGLEALGAFDIDVVRPSAMLAQNVGDPLRALAFAALEGAITPTSEYFQLGSPGGMVDLVPADTFNAKAAPEDARLRSHDEFHSGRRAVVCEPRGLFSLFRKRPVPSRFLSTAGGNFVINFSTQATEQMAARARQTVDIFTGLIAEFGPDLPNGLKIGYATASDPTGKEHLWFEVHGFDGERVDATLMNQPFDVPALQQGQRGWHPIADVTDWVIASPAGQMTPRNLSAARRLRESGWPDGPFGELVKASKNPAA
jgi:uncharacterized protein YegJ (DUF2314 family)